MAVLIYALSFIVLPFFLISVNAENLYVPSEQYKTITRALMESRPGDTVIVKPGAYREQIVINSGVTLVSEKQFGAAIDGGGRGNTVTITGNGTIIGFDVRHGVCGIFSRSVGATIRECRIYKNRGSGILCAGSLPDIEDCVIVFNGGSGIQAFDIVGGSTTISHNTIAYNSNNGILITSSVPLQIENNIIAKNKAIAISCEEGPELISLDNNVIFDNYGRAFEMPPDNFSFNPLFAAPKKRDIDFSLQKDSQALNRSKTGDDLGARINNKN